MGWLVHYKLSILSTQNQRLFHGQVFREIDFHGRSNSLTKRVQEKLNLSRYTSLSFTLIFKKLNDQIVRRQRLALISSLAANSAVKSRLSAIKAVSRASTS